MVPTPLLAVTVIVTGPRTVGVPVIVAVPLWLSTKFQAGRQARVSVRATTGKPMVPTLNVPACPSVNVAVLALRIEGDSSTVMVSTCAEGEPLLAVMVAR